MEHIRRAAWIISQFIWDFGLPYRCRNDLQLCLSPSSRNLDQLDSRQQGNHSKMATEQTYIMIKYALARFQALEKFRSYEA